MTGTVRASSLAGYADLARRVGLDPLRMLDSVGIPRAALTDPDLRFSITAGRDLLEASARAAPDFGLRMSEMRTPSIMGPLALVIRDQPTARAVIQSLARYVSLHTDAARVFLDETQDGAIARLTMWYPAPGPCLQATELSMGQLAQILRIPLGPGWRASSVSLVSAPPASLETHRRVLGPNISFNQDFNGFLIHRSELDHKNPGADSAMAREAERYAERLAESSRASVPDRVAELAYGLLPLGHCTVDFVSRQLGVETRTLQRQLSEHGTTFNEVVQKTRLALVPQFLGQSDRPLAEVADLLGFSALSAFSRWHKTHYGQSASAHRDAARNAFAAS